MSIAIDKEKCIGCKKCVVVCPGNLIKIGEDQKAFLKYPKDCWACTSCMKECGQGAISLYLGAELGGIGSRLTAKTMGDIVQWQVKKSNGETTTIDVNRKEANQY